jgi:hypothetical protein
MAERALSVFIEHGFACKHFDCTTLFALANTSRKLHASVTFLAPTRELHWLSYNVAFHTVWLLDYLVAANVIMPVPMRKRCTATYTKRTHSLIELRAPTEDGTAVKIPLLRINDLSPAWIKQWFNDYFERFPVYETYTWGYQSSARCYNETGFRLIKTYHFTVCDVYRGIDLF